jgi:UPF0755 protein
VRRRRRSGLGIFSALLSFVLVGALIGVGGLVAALLEINRTGPLAEDKVVVLTREDDSGSIGEQLERAGVIDSAVMFAGMTLVDGTRSGLKRGEYEFKAHSSLKEVEALLLSHKVVQHKFTVPEGLTSEQVVQRLRGEEAFAGDVKEVPREGSLLPDTYFYERGDSRTAMLTRMAKAQAKVVDEVWKRRAPDLPIKSPGELVTLASIVEKETGKTEERPRVAGVFSNRLAKHMKLQSDPTIVYGLVFGKGTLGRPISKADLVQATPFNTYIIDGLPPGPICNPGKAAMEAVANPAKSGDLYFVADGTGGHAFASTLDQHLKNVAHWRQIQGHGGARRWRARRPPAQHARRDRARGRSPLRGRHAGPAAEARPEVVRRAGPGRSAARQAGRQDQNPDRKTFKSRRIEAPAGSHARLGRRAVDAGHGGCQDGRVARRRRHRGQRRVRSCRFRRRPAGQRRPGGERADVGGRARRPASALGQIRRIAICFRPTAGRADDPDHAPAAGRQGRRVRRLRRHGARSAQEQDLRPQLLEGRPGSEVAEELTARAPRQRHSATRLHTASTSPNGQAPCRKP